MKSGYDALTDRPYVIFRQSWCDLWIRGNFWTPAALKQVEQRSVKRVDVETVLCDKTAQVTKGNLPDTFVYQQIQKDRKQLLRMVVGPPEGPEPRARIRTAYYAKVSRYWDKDVISKVVKQHPAYGHMLVLFVFSILSVFCQGPDEQDHVCHTISEQ